MKLLTSIRGLIAALLLVWSLALANGQENYGTVTAGYAEAQTAVSTFAIN